MGLAVAFFVLNRITFSGLVEAGGFSQQAFEGRFTQSAVERVAQMGELLQGVKITNLDYRQLLNNDSKTIFTFLDPPYLVATKSKLYGKNGILHTDFSHEDFETIGGIIISEFERLPQINESIDLAQWRFTILAADLRMISVIKVEKIA